MSLLLLLVGAGTEGGIPEPTTEGFVGRKSRRRRGTAISVRYPGKEPEEINEDDEFLLLL